MIELKKLTKYYGRARGVTDLDLTIKKGEVFGFIGPNGAGKSTTIRLLLSLIYPTSGSAYINGWDCFQDSRKIKQILGYVPSEVNYYEDMKVNDLLQFSGRFYGRDCTERIIELSDRLGLDRTRKINALSYGNRKKAAIVQALLHDPQVLIFDEPTGGLDPLVQNEFFEILKEEQKKGTTILFSSHVLSEVQKVCDRVAIVKDGKILKTEQIETLRKNKFRQVQIFYNENSNPVSYLYTGEITALLTKLAVEKGIENVSIEEPPLEDIFMHYYSEGSCSL